MDSILTCLLLDGSEEECLGAVTNMVVETLNGIQGSAVIVVDFTVYDYANVEAGKGLGARMKKGSANPLANEVRQLTGQAARVVEERDWYDKDLSEFDIDAESEDHKRKDSECTEDEEEAVYSRRQSRSQSKSRSPRRPVQQDDRGGGRLYPLDVWFTLATYIRPEDVARFASLCNATHYIVHTSVFWIQLYKRYYSSEIRLPLELRPATTERAHGIRERVVRMLFYVYPPFVERCRSVVPFENLSSHLEGYCCALMWHRMNQKHCNFYFKMKRGSGSGAKRGCSLMRKTSHAERNGQVDLINGHDNVDHNPEEDYCMLQITCGHFISTSSVMGLVLSKVGISVGHGMRFHKMKLLFQSPQLHARNSHGGGLADAITIVLDPVINAHVLHWWDHQYPRPGYGL